MTMEVHYSHIQSPTKRMFLLKLMERGFIKDAVCVLSNTDASKNHDKYYRVRILNHFYGRVEYGRSGAKPRTDDKNWVHCIRKINEKINKGYEANNLFNKTVLQLGSTCGSGITCSDTLESMKKAAKLPKAIVDMVTAITVDFTSAELRFHDDDDNLLVRIHFPL